MMNKTDKTQANDLKLQEDLERRFGEAMAQEIMAEIKKADGLGKETEKAKEVSGYYGIKALSEGAELYRREARNALQHLKSWKREQAKKQPSGIVEWDGAFLQRKFERKYQFYLRFHKSYFSLYRHAMETYKAKGIVTANPYKEIRRDQPDQTTMSKVA